MIHSFDELEKIARQQPSKRVALAMAEEADALTAIVGAAEADIVEPVLVGNRKEIEDIAVAESLDIGRFTILEADSEVDSARKAVGLVREGKADLLMKGKVATATIMKAVLDKESGLAGRRDTIPYHPYRERPLSQISHHDRRRPQYSAGSGRKK